MDLDLYKFLIVTVVPLWELLLAIVGEKILLIFTLICKIIIFRAVHVTKFSSYSQVMSSSDDCTVRCWDLPTGEELISLSGHKVFIFRMSISAENSAY
jgi:WD40 repeat protein